MLVETIHYYSRGRGYNANKVPELSTPVHEVADNMAHDCMELLVAMGYKRHENNKQIFFDKVLNCNESEEYIFYK